MNTLGWVLILSAILLARSVMRGRVMNIGEDLSDAFLAIVRGDTTELTKVLARTGDGFVPEAGVAGESVGGAAGNAAVAIVGKLKLGAVKPHVKNAAESFASRFGITDVGGWRAVGSVPGSDHPKGLALDFMVSAKNAAGKKKGDALAAALLAEKSTWGITYVIWNKQINHGKGWTPYSGPSDHTDHVHASFEPR